MKRILTTIAVAILTLCTLSAFIVTDDPFEDILKKLEDFTKKFPQEKVHLHLDKPYYAAGDDIWFKAYVIDAKTSIPSTTSDILYVELINDQDSLTKQLKLPMKSGITWGDFKLSDTVKEGNYRIRAYTQYMRNAGTSFFFDKTIKIGNSWGNTIFTNTKSVFNNDGKTDKLTSNVQFSTKDGKPYTNREVSYRVTIDDQNVSKGKGTTDQNGEITIIANNSKLSNFNSGEIVAKITIADEIEVIKRIPIKVNSGAVDIQFFPEGGGITEGLPCKIAFKAVGSSGIGEQISGKIIDNEGTELLQFSSTHLGMGTLFLNPLPNKSYTAIITLANGTEKSVALPKAEKSGYQLSINNLDTSTINVKIMLTADLLNKGDLKLVAHHNGLVYFANKIATTKQIIALTLPKNEFDSGIVQFTLFNANNTPVSERIVFVNNLNDKIAVELMGLKSLYNKRAIVELSINSTNKSKPIQGSFSVAITNTAAVAPDLDNESNILTTLLLTSDLKGYVEKPNHYFLNSDIKTRTALDNLMLTQGWRKINWKQITDNEKPLIVFQPEKTMKISGKITKGGKPVPGGKVTLFSTSRGYFAIDTLSDANGNFNFDQISYTDSVKFVVQARTNKDNKNVTIDLDIIPGQVITANKNTGDIEVNVNETLLSYLKQSDRYFDEQMRQGFLNKTILLKEVKIIEKKNLTPNSQNLNGAGRADQIFTAKDLENAFSLSQYLQGRVAGVNIISGQAISTRSIGFNGPNAMTINLDGMNMGGDFALDDINVNDIESVEVLRTIGNTAIYGSNGTNGVILITTKRGAGTENNYVRYSPGIITFAPKGYEQNREFYSPKYDNLSDQKPDLRTTVYWNPHLVSNTKGSANFTFFNTDEPGTYRIVIEGIDADGNLARNVKTYEVK